MESSICIFEEMNFFSAKLTLIVLLGAGFAGVESESSGITIFGKIKGRDDIGSKNLIFDECNDGEIVEQTITFPGVGFN